jgi:unsaturated chondroitin disaccharide hydrolase
MRTLCATFCVAAAWASLLDPQFEADMVELFSTQADRALTNCNRLNCHNNKATKGSPSKTTNASSTPFATKGVQAWAYSTGWTSGFYPGTLWMLGNLTSNKTITEHAANYTAQQRAQESNTGTHDVGFMVYDSFGKGLEYDTLPTTTVADYEKVIIQTAHSLAVRYSPVVKMTRSWGSNSDNKQFEVIIDNLMNLELLFWAAAKTGNKTLYDIAFNTADNMGKFWIRPDGSTYHLVVFDPKNGSVISRSGTPQGLSKESTWARGQAWGVYGFTLAYRFTKDARFLAYANNVTNYYLTRLPTDMVPKWDFLAKSPQDYRDTSAAAIAASGLLELANYVSGSLPTMYRQAAADTLKALGSPTYSYVDNPAAAESVSHIQLSHIVPHFYLSSLPLFAPSLCHAMVLCARSRSSVLVRSSLVLRKSDLFYGCPCMTRYFPTRTMTAEARSARSSRQTTSSSRHSSVQRGADSKPAQRTAAKQTRKGAEDSAAHKTHGSGAHKTHASTKPRCSRPIN